MPCWALWGGVIGNMPLLPAPWSDAHSRQVAGLLRYYVSNTAYQPVGLASHSLLLRLIGDRVLVDDGL